MNVVLNFQPKEFNQIKKALKEYPAKPVSSKYEEQRWIIGSCSLVLYKSGKLLIQGNKSEDIKNLILKKIKLKDKLVLGIDETGRGENFGPLVVAGVLGYTNSLRELRDSKKTANLKQKYSLVKKNSIAVKHFKALSYEIDALREQGINLNQIQASLINKIIDFFEKKAKKARIIVDGSPIKNVNKKAHFKVKADDFEPVVGAASIIAKYAREKSSDKRKRKTWKNS